jgi:hypothetical protein
MYSTAHPPSEDQPLHSPPPSLVPVDLEGTPLKWHGNPVILTGIFEGIAKFYIRKGRFQPLLKLRAVAMNNGRLAIDSSSAIQFITGTADDPEPTRS